MNLIIGLVITVGCVIGGFAALGGHVGVLMQPFEFIIIVGAALGMFVVANSVRAIKDCGRALVEAFLESGPKGRNFLDTLSVLHALMRDVRAKTHLEIESCLDEPERSEIFNAYPRLLENREVVSFICDYCRLIIRPNATVSDIEALMDEEIETLTYDRFKPVRAMRFVADGLPALGIIAAVLGVIHAMGSLDESPEYLGQLIGSALVGTFAGIFLSYCLVSPLAHKIKAVRQRQLRMFVLIRQTLLAFMNGAMPTIAVEFGRKTIPSKERPSIDELEMETTSARLAIPMIKRRAAEESGWFRGLDFRA